MITIEKYDSEMTSSLWEVYYTSIRMICSGDYSKDQIEAWAPESFDLNMFKEEMNKRNPFVAVSDGKIVGYADLQSDGLIDHFFVHGEFQRQGVGKKLMQAVLLKGENYSRLYSNVSHTAKPLYLKYGFSVERVKDEKIRGVQIENNLMAKNQNSNKQSQQDSPVGSPLL